MGAWHPECALDTCCLKAAVLGAFKITMLSADSEALWELKQAKLVCSKPVFSDEFLDKNSQRQNNHGKGFDTVSCLGSEIQGVS